MDDSSPNPPDHNPAPEQVTIASTSWTREYDAEWQVQELERRSRRCQERGLSILLGLDLLVFGVAWAIDAGLLFWYNKNTHCSDCESTTIFLAVAIILAVLLSLRSICGLCRSL